MKKIFILALSMLFLISAPSFSQVDLADIDISTKKKEILSDSASKVIDKSVFDNAFYLKAGKSIPTGKFGQAPSLGKTAFDSFNGNDGSGAQKGITLEGGFLYYFHRIPLPKRIRFGLDGSITFSKNDLDWTTMDSNFKNEEYSSFLFANKVKSHVLAGVKIGPTLSSKVIDKLIIDFFFKLNPSLSNGPNKYYQEWKDEYNHYYYSLNTEKDETFSLRNSLGFNLRYSFLMLGLEYNYGRVNYVLTESFISSTRPDNPSYAPKVESDTKTQKVSTPISMLLYTVGIKF